MYVPLGPAPAAMRARELAQPAAVLEVLRPDVQPDRLAAAQRAETRPSRPRRAIRPAAADPGRRP